MTSEEMNARQFACEIKNILKILSAVSTLEGAHWNGLSIDWEMVADLANRGYWLINELEKMLIQDAKKENN